ncbi:MAG: hypothetical protein KTR31_34670 [Myxococcales bacterium]|nr:hypothetical protein [Myxococcales bacterium]
MNRSFTASHLILAAVALVVGLALGGMAPRGESRALRAQVAELQARECSRGPGVIGTQVANALRRAPSEAPSSGDARTKVVMPPPEEPEPEEPAENTDDDDFVYFEDGNYEEQPDDSDLNRMIDAMEMRRRQARQALREQADPTEEQEAEIDAIFDDMNSELATLAGDFVQVFQEAGGAEPDRRESMLFARDAIDVLIGTEDALYDVLDPDQAQGMSPEASDPMSYIDGEVVRALREIGP